MRRAAQGSAAETIARVMFEAPVVLQHPTPISVGDDEAATRLFGFAHKRTNYRALGVAVVELPGERFVVSVADVEAALRERGKVAPTVERKSTPAKPLDAKSKESRIDRALGRANLRLAGDSR